MLVHKKCRRIKGRLRASSSHQCSKHGKTIAYIEADVGKAEKLPLEKGATVEFVIFGIYFSTESVAEKTSCMKFEFAWQLSMNFFQRAPSNKAAREAGTWLEST